MKNKLKQYVTINSSIRKLILKKIIVRSNHININNYINSKSYTNSNLENLLYTYQETISKKKHFKDKLISKPINNNKNNLKLKNKKGLKSTNNSLYNKNFKGSNNKVVFCQIQIDNCKLLLLIVTVPLASKKPHNQPL